MPPPVADFDRELHISPYTLRRRLDEGARLVLVDLRRGAPDVPPELGEVHSWTAWTWDGASEVVFLDQDGRTAMRLARRWAAQSWARRSPSSGRHVRALYGGLELWELAMAGTRHLTRIG